MKKKAALLSPLVVASLIGISAAQENTVDWIVEHYEEAVGPQQSSQVMSLNADAGSRVETVKNNFAKFNASQGGGWKASIDQKNGQVRMLYGLSKSYNGKPENVAQAFLKESNAVLGLRGDLTDMKILRVDATPERNHVRMQQMLDGVSVSGAYVLVHSNQKGQVTMVQNGYAGNITPVNSRKIAKDEAVKKVMADLKATVGQNSSFGKARAEETVEFFNDRYYFTWKVTVSSVNPYGFWVYYLNAENAEQLYRGNEIFSMRNGIGKVYKNNKDWQHNKLSVVPLKNLFTEAEDYLTGGLWGKRVDVTDNESDGYGDDPYAPNLKFLYNPYGREKPWFDAVNTYYRVHNAWTWWNNNVVSKYGPEQPTYFYTLSIPVGIGVKMCNAYYTPEILPDYPPGFVFGNENSCVEGSEDLALDDDVVMHEFTHAMMEWSYFGRQFGGPKNGYGRSMGEGNADWFAYLASKDPIIGEVSFAWSDDEYLRNIDNTRRYPENVNDPSYCVGYKDKDADGNEIEVIVYCLPEEHYTGEIWGGYLYDLSQVLKGQALKYVYKGMYYFSPTGGFKNTWSDFYDAIAAQMAAEKDLTGKLTNTVKAWGSMSSRGLLGKMRSTYNSGCYFPSSLPVCEVKKDKDGNIVAVICEPCSAKSDSSAYFSMPLNGKTTLSTEGKFLRSNVCNEYPIALTQSGNLQVTAAGSGTWPSVKLYNADNSLIASSSGNTADRAVLSQSSLAANTTYTIMVCGGTTGKYTLKVSTAL